jgi:hypothetical protein
MIKTLTILLLLPFIVHSQSQKILFQDYSFLGIDGEVRTLRQSSDTLYELKCYIDRPCLVKPQNHYKILSSAKEIGIIILKLERLDTISMTTDPYPAARYLILALKEVDNKKLGYLPINYGLTKTQIDTVHTDVQLLRNNFFFTFFSSEYIKELALLKKITTKEQVMEIIELFKTDKFKPLAESYVKTKTGDMYGSGFSAELLNQACIIKGYNPIGAGLVVDSLMK